MKKIPRTSKINEAVAFLFQWRLQVWINSTIDWIFPPQLTWRESDFGGSYSLNHYMFHPTQKRGSQGREKGRDGKGTDWKRKATIWHSYPEFCVIPKGEVGEKNWWRFSSKLTKIGVGNWLPDDKICGERQSSKAEHVQRHVWVKGVKIWLSRMGRKDEFSFLQIKRISLKPKS